MRHGVGNLDSKRPRYHPVIAWEANNLTNDFIDINRVALDDRYGKVGASLYKRRNGSGPTDGKTNGLFGSQLGTIFSYGSEKNAYRIGALSSIGTYAIADYYLNKGYGLEGWKRRFLRAPVVFVLGVVLFYALEPSN